LIVIDSSALVAIALGEPGARVLGERLAQTPPGRRFLSVANYVEAGTVLAGRHKTPEQAPSDLNELLDAAGITLTPVDDQLARLALVARIRFGKGFGASAGLNYGDSFAYALAKSLDAPLLYTGDDFTATDIKSARNL
jgi:ribonuclease VapC